LKINSNKLINVFENIQFRFGNGIDLNEAWFQM